LEFLTERKKKEQVNKSFGGYFTSDNEPDGIENATHNTLRKKAGLLSLVKYPVGIIRKSY
jgi:hypothetical protein